MRHPVPVLTQKFSVVIRSYRDPFFEVLDNFVQALVLSLPGRPKVAKHYALKGREQGDYRGVSQFFLA